MKVQLQIWCCVIGLLCVNTLVGQSSCLAILRQAQRTLEVNKDPETALRKLQDTEICDFQNALIEERQRLQRAIFAEVDRQREEAQQARTEAEQARARTEIEKLKTQQALARAQKLTDAFYFYEGKYALAYGILPNSWVQEPEFYFIDTNGDQVLTLGSWDKAEQFDAQTGLAKVQRSKGENASFYLLDTLGKVYRTSNDLNNLKSDTEALDLRGMGLTEIPQAVFELEELEILILSDNQIKSIPADIGRLKNLKRLELHNNSARSILFTSLPEEIGQLSELETLSINIQQRSSLYHPVSIDFQALPASMAKLKKLKHLYLDDIKLMTLPDFIGELKSLELLSLKHSKINALPASFGQLWRLQKLYLTHNEISQLPDTFAGLWNLTELDLSINKFQHFPEVLLSLPWIERLSLNHNELNDLPRQIDQLDSLRVLDLADNKISALPTSFGQLEKLQVLNLKNNSIPSWPSAFNTLHQLESLNLEGNTLTSLPNQLGNLELLRYLDLDQNQLSQLPSSISNFSTLQILSVAGNELTSLPSSIEMLLQIQYLDLSNNKITHLSNLGNLPRLKEMRLYQNKDLNIHSLCQAIAKISKPIKLSVYNNPYTVPSQLGIIEIDENLTSIPDEINLVENLQELELKQSQATTISPKIMDLGSLHLIRLVDNSALDHETLITGLVKAKKPIVLYTSYSEVSSFEETDDTSLLQIQLNVPDTLNYVSLLSDQTPLHSIIDYRNVISTADKITLQKRFPRCTFQPQINYDLFMFQQANKNDYELAYATAKMAISVHPERADYWYYLGFYALCQEQYDEAIQATQKVLTLTPEMHFAKSNIALAHLLQDNWSAAEEIYLQWKDHYFESLEATAKVHFLEGIAELEKANITHPNLAKAKALLKKE